MDKIINLLEYKKQIILQGAPGTGKTYLAKKIGEYLTNTDSYTGSISDKDIIENISLGLEIKSINGSAIYKVLNIENRTVTLKKRTENQGNTSFDKIIDFCKTKRWESEINDNDKRRAAALAKYIYDIISNQNNSKGYIELVQFHPSFTYEDFVRGIEVKTDNGLEYISRNKVFGTFADKARKNWDLYKLAQKNEIQDTFTKESKIDQFIDHIQQEIDEKGKYQLTQNVYLCEYDDTRFKYKGDNWVAHPNGLNMKYTELHKIFNSGALERANIKKVADLEQLTISHATYYTKMAEAFRNYKPKPISIYTDVRLQKYILIIDEINRANLPAVFGELIYALEYRGEKVKSMYTVDGNDELIVPPNLYIIGTMNTADRSVGQIDYAIRRRFAFVDMLPKVLSNEPGFDAELFKKVSAFFIQNVDDYINDPENTVLERSEWLSDEFSPGDVWIGHSYFIMKDNNRDIRLNYEIKPILREYLKDGILRESVNGKDIKKAINDL